MMMTRKIVNGFELRLDNREFNSGGNIYLDITTYYKNTNGIDLIIQIARGDKMVQPDAKFSIEAYTPLEKPYIYPDDAPVFILEKTFNTRPESLRYFYAHSADIEAMALEAIKEEEKDKIPKEDWEHAIGNFIVWFTSDEKERKFMFAAMEEYLQIECEDGQLKGKPPYLTVAWP